jgi:hypothetical protein
VTGVQTCALPICDGDKLFVLSLANELFLIENHNREFVEIERLKAEIENFKGK